MHLWAKIIHNPEGGGRRGYICFNEQPVPKTMTENPSHTLLKCIEVPCPLATRHKSTRASRNKYKSSNITMFIIYSYTTLNNTASIKNIWFLLLKHNSIIILKWTQTYIYTGKYKNEAHYLWESHDYLIAKVRNIVGQIHNHLQINTPISDWLQECILRPIKCLSWSQWKILRQNNN